MGSGTFVTHPLCSLTGFVHKAKMSIWGFSCVKPFGQAQASFSLAQGETVRLQHITFALLRKPKVFQSTETGEKNTDCSSLIFYGKHSTAHPIIYWEGVKVGWGNELEEEIEKAPTCVSSAPVRAIPPLQGG